MFNVMVVDDEPVIRFGLKASVDWHKEGLHYLGDFPNGAEALKAAEGKTVDLLITDIKMPVMDGLTLMKEMIQRFPRLKVILVSSYTDFEYVREGLKLGAVDYCLKPTLEPEEFVKLIRKCVDMIKKDTQVQEQLKLANKSTILGERKALEQAVKKVILEGSAINDFQQSGKVEENFLVITMGLNNIDKLDEQYGFLYKTMILEDVQNYFYKNIDEGICFPINENQILFMLKTASDFQGFIGKLKQEIESETNTSFTAGYEIIKDLSNIKEGFEKSREASERRFFNSSATIFHYKSFLERKWPKALLQQVLSNYDKQSLEEFLSKRFEEWESEATSPRVIRKEACEIVRQLFMNALPVDVLMEKCEQLKKVETIEELRKILFQQIDDLSEFITQKQYPVQSDNAIMKKALNYIHEHYTEELTLQLVSGHVHISRNYFSILFKRTVGKNFIDYVIDLRIHKAKELLKTTSLKIYEVAEQSGFNDVKYFSKLFKRMMGSSPVDFRSKSQNP
ncbi:response regulator [Mesobacillus foraminis]|uniref:response regulator transcription factor n=1 Tax=Mesobacillus foraminis TaxID=279826 RepID=UPI001BEA6423|nr:response regulator [Mesobacillus foraminis]MBT2755841.1 response regulator [Mesobacillus foraminis]